MSDPSFSNLDQWLFELAEGNLSPEQVAKLDAFLLRNPSLDVDKDMWHLSKVDNKIVSFPNKESLHRKPVIHYWNYASTTAVVLILALFSLEYFGMSSLTQGNYVVASSSTQNSISTTKKTNSPNKPAELQLDVPYLHLLPLFNVNSVDLFNPFYSVYPSGMFSENQVILIAGNGFENTTTSTFSNQPKLKVKRVDASHLNKAKYNWSHETSKSHNKSDKVKLNSFSSRMRKLKRSFERMMNNPVSLKNLKDQNYLVPGMQANDVNFSSTGTHLATRFQASSRYQWAGENNSQLMNQVSIDGYVFPIRGGIGLQVFQQNYQNGGINNTYAALTYSPKFSINKNITIEPAFRFKMGYQSIDANKLNTGDAIEIERRNSGQFYSLGQTPQGKSAWFKDLGASILINTKWFYAGAQVDNIFRHDINYYGSESSVRSSIHGVYSLGTDYVSKNEKYGVSTYLVYQNYGALSELWLGVNGRIHWFTIGGSVSSNLEPAASIGMKFKHFNLSYNTDYTYSEMNQKNALSHQLTIRFLTNQSRYKQRLLNL